ncbi:molecular chaperone DnaJ [bacterium]|jgi:molecular chaperone DnaJ|nr:molecular chaperone DnaJ [bacterium]MBT4122259.1 molecular chaperone DnaJ [bacterium]MBT4334925.1 molecular chaperone DnaJ [bacterium]MBT4763998.1 molecular chaperone DnaJ [bacterium]MBT5401370.1 molecular chaperone DnaJ [bacterium]
MSKDYYSILGVDKKATQDDIKKAFRKKAHEHHPDKGNGNADKFKELNEAYQVLGKPEKRQQYDQFGSNFNGAQGPQGFSGGFNTGGTRVNVDDLGDIFGDIFGGGFGRGRTQSRRPSRGADIEARLSISFEEAVFGVEKVIDLSKYVLCTKCSGNGAEPGASIDTCKKCQGSGQIQITRQTIFGAFPSVATCPECQGAGKIPSKRCTKCHGEGRHKEKETINIKIPKGIDNNETIRLSGKGEVGEKGSISGDLYIHIQVSASRLFQREGYNVYSEKLIPFSIFTLGGKTKIRTVHGDVNLKIPAGTTAGKEFVLKGKGVPKLRGRGTGDHFVKVNVAIPKSLNKKQKKLLNEIDKEGI